jgi:general secretion pathway protein H
VPDKSSPTGSGSCSGFTLVELLVVLAIIGLLLVSASALLSAGRPAADVKAAAFGLAEALRTARALAEVSGKETRVAINVADRAYALTLGGAVRRLPRRMGIRFRGPQGEVQGEDAAIRFFPDGSSTGGELTLWEGGGAHHVRVHWLTGRISVDE